MFRPASPAPRPILCTDAVRLRAVVVIFSMSECFLTNCYSSPAGLRLSSRRVMGRVAATCHRASAHTGSSRYIDINLFSSVIFQKYSKAVIILRKLFVASILSFAGNKPSSVERRFRYSCMYFFTVILRVWHSYCYDNCG